MKWSASGSWCGVDLIATAALKSGRGNCGERVWVREGEGEHDCAIHLCELLMLGSAVELVSWWRWSGSCWHCWRLRWKMLDKGEMLHSALCYRDFWFVVCHCWQSGEKLFCGVAVQSENGWLNWDFGLLLLTGGMLHSHAGIIRGRVEWCSFATKHRMKRREFKGEIRYFVENLVALWQSNDMYWWRESVRDSDWLKRVWLVL